MREIKNNGNNLIHMVTAAFQDRGRSKSVLEMWFYSQTASHNFLAFT